METFRPEDFFCKNQVLKSLPKQPVVTYDPDNPEHSVKSESESSEPSVKSNLIGESDSASGKQIDSEKEVSMRQEDH